MTGARALALGSLLLASAPSRSALARDGDVSGMTPLARLWTGLPYRTAVEVSGSTVFGFVGLDSGLEIFNLSTAQFAGALYLPGPAWDVAVSGSLVYVADGDGGIRIVNVANPAAPIEAGALVMDGARAVAVSGNTAYVAVTGPPPARNHGLAVVDVTTPSAPAARGFLPLPNGALDVQLSGTVALVATGSELAGPHGLYLVDVSVPASPTLLGSLPTGYPVHEIALAGTTAYLAAGFPSSGALLVADVTTPAAPALLATAPIEDAAIGISVAGSEAYLAARSLGLVLFSVSNPSAPVRQGAASTGRETYSVVAKFGGVLLGERSSSGIAALAIADATNPQSPVVLGGFSFAEATDAAGGPALAYLLRRDGLSIFDTSTPATPSFLGIYGPAGADFSALDVEGTIAAVAEGKTVHLVNVTDPAAPALLGSIDVASGLAVRPVLRSPRLYVVNGRGLEVFDITTPATPAPIGNFSTAGPSSGLAIFGSTGFLTAGNTLHVLDLGAASPSSVGSLQFTGETLLGVDVDATRKLAVVTGQNRVLYAVDVSVPAAPFGIGQGPAGSAYSVKLIGDRAVLAGGEAGALIYDLSTPATPVLEASQDTSGALYALGTDGNLLLLATQAAQHWITRCDTCVATCVPTSPLLGLNSLQMAFVAPNFEYRWSVLSGCCESNVAMTTDKTRLPDLWMDPPVASSASGTYSDAVPPPAVGQVAYHQVFGRDSCTGGSVEP